MVPSDALSRRAVIALIALVLSLGTCSALGRPVDAREAAVAASGALARLSGATPRGDADADVASLEPLVSSASGAVVGYLARLSPAGCLVLSAETRLPAVIVYDLDETGSPDDEGRAAMLQIATLDLELRAEALGLGLVGDAAQAAAQDEWHAATSRAPSDAIADTEPLIGPLVETPTWSQSAPWNDRCPLDPRTGERSAAGCVATALAQILAYWRAPSRIEFGPDADYRTTTRGISIDASDASLESISYSTTSWRNPSDETMRDLTWAAGVSVRMDYTSSGSGAYLADAAVALAGSASPYASDVRPDAWGYASADVRTCVNSFWGSPYYESVDAFYGDLRDDLREGRPALLCVAKTGTRVGHVLICDGYDPVTRAYHLNLGWGGNGDAWYVLPNDIPGGYNVVEYGVLNIRPGEQEALPPAGVADSALGDEAELRALRTLAYPNPTWGPVEFRCDGAWKLPDPVTAWVDVFTLAGELVWSSDPGAPDGIAWNGLDAEGVPVGRGVYVCVMTVSSGTRAHRVRSTLFVEP